MAINLYKKQQLFYVLSMKPIYCAVYLDFRPTYPLCVILCQNLTFALLFPLDLPPVYSFSPIAMGYKAGPSSPEALLAEQPRVEEEPAEPESKSLPHPCHIQPLTVEEEMRKEENGGDCEVVESQNRVTEEAGNETKGCSISEPQIKISGSPPCTFSVPVSDPACPAGKTLKVDLSMGCLGQKAGLEEPQQSKEQEDDGVLGKQDMREDEGEKKESEPAECIVSVLAETEEEDGCKDGDNAEIVEDKEEEEVGSGKGEGFSELTCSSPAPSPSADPVLPDTTSTADQLEGAYIRSLELLIAAALCATRDALYPPVPVDQTPCPSSHHGMEILGELAELEIQQRNREGKEKDTEGEDYFKKAPSFSLLGVLQLVTYLLLLAARKMVTGRFV